MSNKTEIRYLSPVDIEKRKQSKQCRFKKMGIKYETKIISAHRTPVRMYDFASSAEKKGIGVIIAGAGGSANLHGMI